MVRTLFASCLIALTGCGGGGPPVPAANVSSAQQETVSRIGDITIRPRNDLTQREAVYAPLEVRKLPLDELPAEPPDLLVDVPV